MELVSVYVGKLLTSVSIPKRVSAKVELWRISGAAMLLLFQSLKGFQPKWNSVIVLSLDIGFGFNP